MLCANFINCEWTTKFCQCKTLLIRTISVTCMCASMYVYDGMCMFLFWLAVLWYAHFVPENIKFWSKMRFLSVPTSIWQFKVYLRYLDIFMQFHKKHRKKYQRQSLPKYTKAATSMLCRVKTCAQWENFSQCSMFVDSTLTLATATRFCATYCKLHTDSTTNHR